VPGGGKCYFTHCPSQKMVINEARAYCESKGGALASIHNEVDNNKILEMLAGQDAWIGALRVSGNGAWTQGDWVWEDGSDWIKPTWRTDGLRSGKDRESRIAIWTDGVWHDWNHGHQYARGVVCQIVASPPQPQPKSWFKVWGSGSVNGPGPKPNKADFNQQIRDGADGGKVVMRRKCQNCGAEHKEIYYVRRAGVDSFDFYERFLVTWHDEGFKTDFDLYSTEEDALLERNAWAFCNSAVRVNHQGVAFPRDCGVTGFVGGQWNGLNSGHQDYSFEILTTDFPVNVGR